MGRDTKAQRHGGGLDLGRGHHRAGHDPGAAVAKTRRDTAWKTAKSKVRRLAAQWQMHPAVTPTLLSKLGLKPRDTTPTAVEQQLGAGWRPHAILTRSPSTILPHGVAGGDLVRYIARWRTARGLVGPWSETVECTLPG